jgi:glycosyltransferase involved in cell wall biosynthesis
MQRAEDAACRDADVVVSMLPLSEPHLREHGLPPGRFEYVPNGVDPDEWSASADQLAPSVLPADHVSAMAEARERDHLLVAYTGAHGIANDLDALLDAATLMRDDPVTWLLVGDGPEKQRLEQLAAVRGLDRIRFLDPVPKSAIPALLRAMDVLFIGLRPEPVFRFGISPNKLMDYMMAGRPIVSAIAAGNDPVSEAGCGITVAPGRPEATAAAVRQLAAMTQGEREAMGMRGLAYVRARHTYPVLATRFLDAIEAARAERGAR